MRISYQWLSEWIEQPPPVGDLAELLTNAGLEVEAIEKLGQGLDKIVVGEVRSKEPVAGSDKLHLCSVDVGSGEALQIVCGASNYEVGAKVPTALVGATLPGGLHIEARKVRGVPSYGMLCSAKEIGVDEDASGLMLLEADAVVGTPIVEHLHLDDVVFTLNATPNRPDWLSHLGVAREVAALVGSRLVLPESAPAESGEAAAIPLRIDSPERCTRYAARIVEGLRFAPSPTWMQARLRACGMRPLGNLIDVTNYVLLEAGQPLHAFDLDQVKGGIVVRTAAEGEGMTTLDGKERRLSSDDLVIADEQGPLVLAGVMGGERAEVGEGTTRVLLESAHFLPAGIRRSARRHGLHSESSHRFERGADPGEAVRWSLDRAARLLAELAGGKVRVGVVEEHPEPATPRKVALRFDKVDALLGVEVGAEASRRILKDLGFEEESGGEKEGEASFRVPTFRVDVEREVDLIEEVARIRGYDSIPVALPRASARPAEDGRSRKVLQAVQQVLRGAGLDEAVHLAFEAPEDAKLLGIPEPGLPLSNPLVAHQSQMRTRLLPGLLRTVAHNRNRGAQEVRLWEHGKVFFARPGKDQPVEEPRHLAGVLWGPRASPSWASGDEPVDFYDLKGVVEALLRELRIADADWSLADWSHLHPRSATSLSAGGVHLGSLGELHPSVAEAFDLPRGVFVFELSLDELERLARLEPTYRDVPRFPAVLRDLAVVVPSEVPAEALRRVLLGPAGGDLVEDVELFDVYEGANVGEGKKSLAFAIRYRAPERTLTDAEVQTVHDALVAALGERFGATLRA